MGLPWIGYHSFLDTGTVTASTTDTAYSVANVKDRLTFTWWENEPSSESDNTKAYINIDMGSAQTGPTYLAITGHNIGTSHTGCTVGVYYSDDGVSYTLGVQQPATGTWIAHDNSIVMDLSSVSWGGTHRYWRVWFEFLTAGTAIRVAALALGYRLEITEYMTRGFDPYAQGLKFRQFRSRGGTFTGGIVDHTTQRVKLKFGEAGLSTTAFFNATAVPCWRDFLTDYWQRGLPWWFKSGWETDVTSGTGTVTFPGWYCWAPDNAKSSTPSIFHNRRGWQFEFDVLVETYPV